MGTMTLGGFAFQALEVPEVIPFGSEQRMSVKKLVGGKRVIDAIGADPIPIRWSGRFFGPGSIDRARQLKAFCDAGLPLDLIWDTIVYSVVVKSFTAEYRFNEIPYTIECEVLEDRGTTPPQDAQSGVDTLFSVDFAAAQIQAAAIGSPVLNSSMATLSTAASAVPSFAPATNSQVQSVLNPLMAAQQVVATLKASTDSALGAAATLAGVIPGAPISQSLAALRSVAAAALNAGALKNLDGLLGRMAKNLSAVTTSVRVVQVTGGNLYDLASKYYGKPEGWAVIAKANGLRDPSLTGVQTIQIPPYLGTDGGVVSA